MKVLTAPIWLFQMFNGYTNDKGTAKIMPTLDCNGNFIIGKSILIDPTWNLSIPVTNPETNETKPLIEWLEEIDYCFIQNINE